MRLWETARAVLTATDIVVPAPLQRAILPAAQPASDSPLLSPASSAAAPAAASFSALQRALTELQAALSSDESLPAAVAQNLPLLQSALLLLVLHPLLPTTLRCQSAAVVDSLCSSSPSLADAFARLGTAQLVAFLAHHQPVSPSLFLAYRRLSQQQPATAASPVPAQQQAEAAGGAQAGAVRSVSEIDALLAVLKRMPQLDRYLHVYLEQAEKEKEQGAGAESTLPSLHPSLAQEDLELLSRLPIEITGSAEQQQQQQRAAVSPSSSAFSALIAAPSRATAEAAFTSLLSSVLSRYSYSYRAGQRQQREQAARRHADDEFRGLRLLASLCEQQPVCRYLQEHGSLLAAVACWGEREERDMREAVQLARLVANSCSHRDDPQLAEACLQHAPLLLSLVDWAHTSPLQAEQRFLPLASALPSPAVSPASLLSSSALDSPPPASASFPAALPTRGSLSPQSAREALSLFRHSSAARLRQVKQDVVSSLSSMSSSLPPALQSRLPHPTAPLPQAAPAAEETVAQVAAAVGTEEGAAAVDSVKRGAAAAAPAGGDSSRSLRNVLHSQAVRALANLYHQSETLTERRLSEAAAAWQRGGQQDDGDDEEESVWSAMQDRGRAAHPLYADEVYIIHPAFRPLSPRAAASSPLPPSAASWYSSLPTLDLVFVHGLLGNPLRTWRLHTRHDLKTSSGGQRTSGAAADGSGKGDERQAESSEQEEREARRFERYALAQRLQAFLSSRRVQQLITRSAAQQEPGSDGRQQDDGGELDNEDEEEEEDEEREAQSADAEVIWPRDWLPASLPGNVRIVSIGFRSSLLRQSNAASVSLTERAEQFIRKLQLADIPQAQRAGDALPPAPNLVFITHSMGGLLAKQMLFASPPLLSATLGLVFLATPHFGAWLPAQSTTRALLSFLATPSVDLEQLAEDHPHLALLNEHLSRHLRQAVPAAALRVLSMGEGQPTPLPPSRPSSPFSLLLVPPRSANPGFGEFVELQAEDHLNICKPDSLKSAMYSAVVDFVTERQQRQQEAERRRQEAETDEEARRRVQRRLQREIKRIQREGLLPSATV